MFSIYQLAVCIREFSSIDFEEYLDTLVAGFVKQLDGSVTVNIEQGTRIQADFQRVR